MLAAVPHRAPLAMPGAVGQSVPGQGTRARVHRPWVPGHVPPTSDLTVLGQSVLDWSQTRLRLVFDSSYTDLHTSYLELKVW